MIISPTPGVSATPDPPTPLQSGLSGACPRCGAPTLFSGVIRFAAKCRSCQLDFSAFNVGDGPAAFLTLIIGALITGLAIALELTVSPRWWVHVLVWLPVTLLLIGGSLRVTKGVLLSLEYRNVAHEGRIAPPRE